MRIIAIDPGESTGWVSWYDGALEGGTIKHDRVAILALLERVLPDITVFEEFVLYPHMAKALSWNSFYTCEIIGIIKLYVDMMAPTVELVTQKAANKKYSGGKTSDPTWQAIKRNPSVTEHTFDAYLHLMFFMRSARGAQALL